MGGRGGGGGGGAGNTFFSVTWPALVSHNYHHQVQQKTTQPANTSTKIGQNVNKDKTKVMHINNTVDGDILEDVESSTYLGSVIAKDGGADKDIDQDNNWESKVSIPHPETSLAVQSNLTVHQT